MKTIFFAAILALSAPAFAQGTDKTPQAKAADTALDDAMPALNTDAKSEGDTAQKSAVGQQPTEAGTTIVGDNSESPIGLYITPWRSSFAQKDIDRPARLLQEQMLPIDQDVFQRQIQYYNALTAAADKKAGSP
ncbi:MAG: hypothetical protein ACRESS_05040 [Stenotrophobium sp.]